MPIFANYRQVPREAQEVHSIVATPTIDASLLAIVTNWHLVIADFLAIYHLDLYDSAVLARPWPGIRTALFALLDHPDSRLRRALTRR